MHWTIQNIGYRFEDQFIESIQPVMVVTKKWSYLKKRLNVDIPYMLRIDTGDQRAL